MEKKEDNSQMIDNPHGQSFDIETTKPSTPRGVFKSNAKISQSSNLQASFTLFKGFIGTGILALPYSFNTAGLGLSIIVIIIVAVLTTRCFILLLDVADDQVDNDKISLPKLTLQILGNRGKQAVQASMLVMQLGCCIGIIIFTKNFLNHVICEFGIASLCDNTFFSLFFCLALTVPLSMINNMHYFYIPSLAANFFILIGLASQMYYNTQVIHENPELKSNFTSYLGDFHWTKLPLFFGVATFAFEGIGIIFSIRGSMEKPKDFSFLLKNQMVILCIIYLIFPTVCLIAFGDKLPDIIFLTLPTDDPFYLLVQILYGISALLSYPVQLFPALRIMENSKLLRFRLFNERGKCINKKLRYGMRMGVIGLVFLVAFLANSFHLFLNLLGSCVFTFVGFILPVWIYHTHFKGRIKIGTKIVNYTMLVISTFFGIVGSAMSIIKMFNHDSKEGGIHG